MTTSPARKLSSELQGGFLLQVLQEDNKHLKIVSGSAKQISTYFHIENNTNTNQICRRIPQCVITLRPSLLYGFIFTVPPQPVQRGGFLGTSCQSRDRVPPLTGFSLIRTWVTQTAPLTAALERQASFMRQVGTHNG